MLVDFSGPAPRPIVQLGTFDVPNFGDLLFPLILAANVAGVRERLWIRSPTGCDSGWRGGWSRRTRGPIPEHAVLVLGGGNLIKCGSGGIAQYQRSGARYEDLWAPPRSLLTCWNAVGIPRLPDAETRRLLGRVAVEYASVRDERSAEWLAMLGHEPVLVPDTGFAVPSVWPRQSPSEDGRPYATISLKQRDLGGALEEVVRSLSELARASGAKLVLLPMGAIHGDDRLAREVAESSESPCSVELLDPRDLGVVVRTLAGARLHIGSSLHGGIVSASYGVPVLWVTQMAKRGLPKFDGALRWMPSGTRIFQTWPEAVSLAQDILSGASRPEPLATEVTTRLQAHWGRLSKLLSR